jgi:hypothetical protein
VAIGRPELQRLRTALIPFERRQHLLWQRCIEIFWSFEFSLENAKVAFFRGGRQCNKLCQGFTRFGNNDFLSGVNFVDES